MNAVTVLFSFIFIFSCCLCPNFKCFWKILIRQSLPSLLLLVLYIQMMKKSLLMPAGHFHIFLMVQMIKYKLSLMLVFANVLLSFYCEYLIWFMSYSSGYSFFSAWQGSPKCWFLFLFLVIHHLLFSFLPCGQLVISSQEMIIKLRYWHHIFCYTLLTLILFLFWSFIYFSIFWRTPHIGYVHGKNWSLVSCYSLELQELHNCSLQLWQCECALIASITIWYTWSLWHSL